MNSLPRLRDACVAAAVAFAGAAMAAEPDPVTLFAQRHAEKATQGLFPAQLDESLAPADRAWLRDERARFQRTLAERVKAFVDAEQPDLGDPHWPDALRLMLLARLTEATARALLRLPADARIAELRRVAMARPGVCPSGPLDTSPPSPRMPGSGRPVELVVALGAAQAFDAPLPEPPAMPLGQRMAMAAVVALEQPAPGGEPLPASLRRVASALRRGETPADGDLQGCALMRWWARAALRQPAPLRLEAADALLHHHAVRHGHSVVSEVGEGPAGRDAPPGYPPAAAAWGVQGTVVLEVEVGPEGRAREARIVERRLNVPGFRGARTLSFDKVFDDAAVAQALSARYDDRLPSGGPLPERQRIELVWRLDR